MVKIIKEFIVNISLLTMLKSDPKYIKMIKDLVVHNHAMEEMDCVEKVVVDGHYSVTIKQKLTPKMKDLRSFMLMGDIG